MSEKEMRELDAWIGTNIFDVPFNRDWVGISNSLPHYTTARAAAMEVLEKCAEKCGTIKIVSIGLMWWVNDNQKSCEGKANTLPLAICKFAKELYEKQT